MAKSICKEEFMRLIGNHAGISKSPRVVLNEALDAFDLVLNRNCSVGYFPIFNDTRYYLITDELGNSCGSIFVGCDSFSFAFDSRNEKVLISLNVDKSKFDDINYHRSVNYTKCLSEGIEDEYIDDLTGEIKNRSGDFSLIVKELCSNEVLDVSGRVVKSQATLSLTDPEFMNVDRSDFNGVADYSNNHAPIVAQYYLKTVSGESVYGELNGVSISDTDDRIYLPKLKFKIDFDNDVLISNIEDIINNRLNSEELNYPKTCCLDNLDLEIVNGNDLKKEFFGSDDDEPRNN